MIYKSKGGVKTAILVFAKWMALHFLYCSSLLKTCCSYFIFLKTFIYFFSVYVRGCASALGHVSVREQFSGVASPSAVRVLGLDLPSSGFGSSKCYTCCAL